MVGACSCCEDQVQLIMNNGRSKPATKQPLVTGNASLSSGRGSTLEITADTTPLRSGRAGGRLGPMFSRSKTSVTESQVQRRSGDGVDVMENFRRGKALSENNNEREAVTPGLHKFLQHSALIIQGKHAKKHNQKRNSQTDAGGTGDSAGCIATNSSSDSRSESLHGGEARLTVSSQNLSRQRPAQRSVLSETRNVPHTSVHKITIPVIPRIIKPAEIAKDLLHTDHPSTVIVNACCLSGNQSPPRQLSYNSTAAETTAIASIGQNGELASTSAEGGSLGSIDASTAEQVKLKDDLQQSAIGKKRFHSGVSDTTCTTPTITTYSASSFSSLTSSQAAATSCTSSTFALPAQLTTIHGSDESPFPSGLRQRKSTSSLPSTATKVESPFQHSQSTNNTSVQSQQTVVVAHMTQSSEPILMEQTSNSQIMRGGVTARVKRLSTVSDATTPQRDSALLGKSSVVSSSVLTGSFSSDNAETSPEATKGYSQISTEQLLTIRNNIKNAEYALKKAAKIEDQAKRAPELERRVKELEIELVELRKTQKLELDAHRRRILEKLDRQGTSHSISTTTTSETTKSSNSDSSISTIHQNADARLQYNDAPISISDTQMLDNSSLENHYEPGEGSTTNRGGFHALKDKFESMITENGGRLGMAPKEGKLHTLTDFRKPVPPPLPLHARHESYQSSNRPIPTATKSTMTACPVAPPPPAESVTETSESTTSTVQKSPLVPCSRADAATMTVIKIIDDFATQTSKILRVDSSSQAAFSTESTFTQTASLLEDSSTQTVKKVPVSRATDVSSRQSYARGRLQMSSIMVTEISGCESRDFQCQAQPVVREIETQASAETVEIGAQASPGTAEMEIQAVVEKVEAEVGTASVEMVENGCGTEAVEVVERGCEAGLVVTAEVSCGTEMLEVQDGGCQTQAGAKAERSSTPICTGLLSAPQISQTDLYNFYTDDPQPLPRRQRHSTQAIHIDCGQNGSAEEGYKSISDVSPINFRQDSDAYISSGHGKSLSIDTHAHHHHRHHSLDRETSLAGPVEVRLVSSYSNDEQDSDVADDSSIAELDASPARSTRRTPKKSNISATTLESLDSYTLESLDLDEIDAYLQNTSFGSSAGLPDVYASPNQAPQHSYILSQWEALSHATNPQYLNTIDLFVSRLASAKYNLSLRNSVGDTAMHLAVLNANYGLLKSTLDHFPREAVRKAFKIHNETGFTPLHISVAMLQADSLGKRKLLERLLEMFVEREELSLETRREPASYALGLAAGYGNAVACEVILNIARAEGFLEELLNEQDGVGNSALMLAAAKNNCGVISLLLSEDDIDITLRNQHGQNAFNLAISGHHRQAGIILYQYSQSKLNT